MKAILLVAAVIVLAIVVAAQIRVLQRCAQSTLFTNSTRLSWWGACDVKVVPGAMFGVYGEWVSIADVQPEY